MRGAGVASLTPNTAMLTTLLLGSMVHLAPAPGDCDHLSFFSPFVGAARVVDVATNQDQDHCFAWSAFTPAPGQSAIYYQATNASGSPLIAAQVVTVLGDRFVGPVIADVADGSMMVVCWAELFGSYSIVRLVAIETDGWTVVAEDGNGVRGQVLEIDLGGDTNGPAALIAYTDSENQLSTWRVEPQFPPGQNLGDFAFGGNLVQDIAPELKHPRVSRGDPWLVTWESGEPTDRDVRVMRVSPGGGSLTPPQTLFEDSGLSERLPCAAGQGPLKALSYTVFDTSTGESEVFAVSIDLDQCGPLSICPADPPYQLNDGPERVVITNALDVNNAAVCDRPEVLGVFTSRTIPRVSDMGDPPFGDTPMIVWRGDSCFSAEVAVQAQIVDACP